MSVNNSEDDVLAYADLDEAESPQKSLSLDNAARKSWSLMDRRTDQDVLQEMGVSLLEPDEMEPQCDPSTATVLHHKPPLKRKHDIENVNPNVNSSLTSPRSKFSPKSPRSKFCSPGTSRGKVFSPSPGTSRVKSPRSTDKCKSLQQTDQQILETTLLEEFLLDEETPLAQSVSAQYLPTLGSGFSAGSVTGSGGKRHRTSYTSSYVSTPHTSSTKSSPILNMSTALGLEEELIISRRNRAEPQGADSFAALSDEMLLSVFRWLQKRTLAHCMLVCKRWHRVACDETLWQRLDLGNKTLSKDALGRILARKPIIVRLASSEIGHWSPMSAPAPSRIQYLDLSMCSSDHNTLASLLERCPFLKKLSLESVPLVDEICHLIGKCSNLETLNLTMAQGITEFGLTSILEGCTSLQSLNISWCGLSEPALEVLVATLPPRLQRLNVGGARIMTDDMVAELVQRCPRLLELDLSDCSRLNQPTILSLLSLGRLEHLALSRCYQLPPHALTKLSGMAALQYLEVWGILQTASLNALRSALPAIQINQFMFSAIARPTVGTRRTSIWGLRTRD